MIARLGYAETLGNKQRNKEYKLDLAEVAKVGAESAENCNFKLRDLI